MTIMVKSRSRRNAKEDDADGLIERHEVMNTTLGIQERTRRGEEDKDKEDGERKKKKKFMSNDNDDMTITTFSLLSEYL
jgi:hypothetical protein